MMILGERHVPPSLLTAWVLISAAFSRNLGLPESVNLLFLSRF